MTAAKKPTLLQALGDKRMAAVLLMSFASGLPFNLTGFTVQAWLASEGLDIKAIGIFTLVSVCPISSSFCGHRYSIATCRRYWAVAAAGF